MEQDHDNDNELNPANDNFSNLAEVPYDPMHEIDESSCRAMWAAAILQAIIDASGKNCNSLDQAKARIWLEGKGGIFSEFDAVCELAGVDPEKTRKRCAEILRGESEKIDFRCTKKADPKNRMMEDRKRYYQRAERNKHIRRQRKEKILFPNTATIAETDSKNIPHNDNDSFINQSAERIYGQ